MARQMKTFVGFGLGPIQSGLFLFEAYMSGNFSRYVVAEVDSELVAAVRENRGSYTINIARKGRISQVKVQGVEVFNPRIEAERKAVVRAVAEADEMATALPSVKFFDAGEEASVARMLAEGLGKRAAAKPGIIYAAENHNQAAEILVGNLRRYAPASDLACVQALNTVIGKMSGVIVDVEERNELGLATLTPTLGRAVLVEEFNRILISRLTLPAYHRGIEVFTEKDDLLPFEEAKLYGHNAIHALIGYLADLRGIRTMAEAGGCQDLMEIARAAFIEESGAALIRRHAKLGEGLFTAEGYRAYAEDLLERMVRPTLNDLVARVIRDHERKLGYEDRLFGTMRLALRHGVEPRNMAKGAAAAVLSLIKHRGSLKNPAAEIPEAGGELTEQRLARLLARLWEERKDEYTGRILKLTWQALEELRVGCMTIPAGDR